MNGQALLDGTVINANFSGGQVTGSGGCNTYNAGFSTNGNNVSIGYPTSTQIACAPEVMDQETRYFQTLSGVVTYEITASNLVFRDGGGNITLLFGPGIAPR
jgi:heat shock protein HslJ